MKYPKIGQAPDPRLVDLSDRLRNLSNQILRVHEGGRDEIEAASRAIDDVAASLSEITSEADTPRVMGAHEVHATRPYYFPGALEPRVHISHPWMTGVQEGDRRHGQVRFDLIHEGPPGWAHGGHIAWFFDQAFGQHVVAGEGGGPTHRLEVVYRRGTPLGRVLDYEIRTERREDRKVFASARLQDGDALLAEASALFVEPKQGFRKGD